MYRRALIILALVFPAWLHAANVRVLASNAGSGDGSLPIAGLTFVGGVLYGTANSGGAKGQGAIYSVDPKTGAYTLLYSFQGGADGSAPYGALCNAGGVLYGTTTNNAYYGGTLFSFNPQNGTHTVLHTFSGTDGGWPTATLIAANGKIYGAASVGGVNNHGTLFEFSPATQAFQVLYSFGNAPDAGGPTSSVTLLGGSLYGAATNGGATSHGALYRFDLATGKETVAYSFTGEADGEYPSASLVASGGQLYGSTETTIFSFAPATQSLTTLATLDYATQGTSVQFDVKPFDGLLYGVSGAGGTAGLGTIISLDPVSGAVSVVASMSGGLTGSEPVGAPIVVNGRLYGTGVYGGTADAGLLFRADLSTGAITALHSFTGPTAGATEALGFANGTLLLTSTQGGSAGLGSITSIDPSTGATTPVLAFTGLPTGTAPTAPVTGQEKFLYGTTSFGGGTGCQGVGCGTLYQLDPTTGAQRLLYSFGATPADGIHPGGKPVWLDGVLYGIASGGGASCCGTLYAYDPKTGTETTLYNFGDLRPGNGLTLLGNTVYGVTEQGGSYAAGTLFSYTPSSGSFTTLHSFNPAVDGAYPRNPPVAGGGLLYGGSNSGLIYSFNPETSAFTTLLNLNDLHICCEPNGGLAYFHHVLYGTTNLGPGNEYLAGCGTVFSVDLATGAGTTVFDFTCGADGAYPSNALVVFDGAVYGTTTAGGANGMGAVFQITQ